MRGVIKSLLGLLAALLFVVAVNWFSVTGVAYGHWRADPRNAPVSLWAHYAYLLKMDVLDLDLTGIESSASKADVTRMIFQAAEVFRERHFTQVRLAFRGSAKFTMDGDDFQQLGRAYASGENPVYLMRMLPEQMKTPDGLPAFSTWTGGALGVLGAQMEDLNQLHEGWYLNELTLAP